MRVTRVRKRFRYEGDPAEVRVEFSINEACDVAQALLECVDVAPLGQQLQHALEVTEDADGDRLCGPRIGTPGPRVVRESTVQRVERSGASPEFKKAARKAIQTNPTEAGLSP